MRLRRSSCFWNVPKKYRRALLLPHQEGALCSYRGSVGQDLCSCGDARGLCLGLHLMTADRESGSSGRQSPHQGDMWRHGCPKSPTWDSDDESCYRAKLVRRQGVPLLGRLGNCEGGIELPRCHGFVVLVAGWILPEEPLCHSKQR